MIIEIWLWLASISVLLFVLGIIYAKVYEKVMLLAISAPFTLLTMIYCFDIETSCCGLNVQQVYGTILTAHNYYHLAWFFSLMFLVTVILMFAQVMWGVFKAEVPADEPQPLHFKE